MGEQRRFGFDKLADQAADFIYQLIDYQSKNYPLEGTPIERLFLVAFDWRCRLGDPEMLQLVVPVAGESIEECLSEAVKSRNVVVAPQAQLEDWRVDFLLHAYRRRDERWHRAIVECDGHDFHERTKEQAAKDRSRDRWAQSEGFRLFRFTGHELWGDPWGRVSEVIQWIEEVRYGAHP